MNITIITVGKIKEHFYRDALLEYKKRLSRYCKLEIIEVADEKTKENATFAEEQLVLEKEAVRILKYVKQNSYVIALSIKGKTYSSVDLAKKIENLGIVGKSDVTFIIGGSLGLHESVIQECKEELSFSKMTFPHQLMRVILLEQIYRCFRIIAKEPYHK